MQKRRKEKKGINFCDAVSPRSAQLFLSLQLASKKSRKEINTAEDEKKNVRIRTKGVTMSRDLKELKLRCKQNFLRDEKKNFMIEKKFNLRNDKAESEWRRSTTVVECTRISLVYK